MNKFKLFFLFAFFVLIIFNLNSCNVKNLSENKLKTKFVCDEDKYNIDFDKYKSLKKYNYNVDITTSKVVEKTSDIRQNLLKIKNIEIESFSSNESGGNIRAYIPYRESELIEKIFAGDPEITNFSKGSSDIGSSYVEYAEKYYITKILMDNFPEVNNIISNESCDKIDTSNFRRMLQDNIRSYESTMTSYKQQMNKVELYIYIRKQGQ
ncbi:MAG: hypothetical protein AB1782_03315 [Cyanobacteriota bacterium]